MAESKSARYHTKIAKSYDSEYTDRYWETHSKIEWKRLDKYLPKGKSLILDAGGGTGEFSIAFAKRGHNVVLTDVSSGMLDVARKKIAKLRLGNKITVMPQDITDMKDFRDGQFDFAVSLGDPVSYCMDECAAVSELARVVKRGAYVIITVDSYYASMLNLIRRNDVQELKNLIKTGNTTFPFDYPQHNFKVGELGGLFEQSGLEVVEIFGIISLLNKIPRKEREHILQDDANFRKLMGLELELSSEPSVLGTASHLGIVGRKL